MLVKNLPTREGTSVNPDFIGIRTLEGELKISHKKRNFGMTVSTAECVLQKPHVNYHFKLSDIVSIVPFQNSRHTPPVAFESQRSVGQEFAKLNFDLPHFRFFVKQLTVHNRSGLFRLGPSEIIVPVIPELLRAISEHGGLQAFET